MITVNELRAEVLKKAWEMRKESVKALQGRFEKTFSLCLKLAWASVKTEKKYYTKKELVEIAEYEARESVRKAEEERKAVEAAKEFEANKATSKTFTVAPWFAKKNMLLTSNNEVFTLVKETTKAMLLILEGTTQQFWAPKSVCTACLEERPEYLKALAM